MNIAEVDLHIHISKQLYEQIKEKADSLNVSTVSVIRMACSEFVNKK